MFDSDPDRTEESVHGTPPTRDEIQTVLRQESVTNPRLDVTQFLPVFKRLNRVFAGVLVVFFTGVVLNLGIATIGLSPYSASTVFRVVLWVLVLGVGMFTLTGIVVSGVAYRSASRTLAEFDTRTDAYQNAVEVRRISLLIGVVMVLTLAALVVSFHTYLLQSGIVV